MVMKKRVFHSRSDVRGYEKVHLHSRIDVRGYGKV